LGGLFTSTALTLLVIPALYAQFGRWFMPKPKRAALEATLSSNGAPQSTVIYKP
jgi:hypothetical protein